MNAIDPTIHDLMLAIGQRARAAAKVLAFASTDAKNDKAPLRGFEKNPPGNASRSGVYRLRYVIRPLVRS